MAAPDSTIVPGPRHAAEAVDALRSPDGWLMASGRGTRFASLFARDALIAALQLLPVDPSIAQATLAALARHLGSQVDPEREEEPGKVPHEVRDRDLAAYVEHGWPVRDDGLVYYGSVDASAWWLIVFAALARGGHDVRVHRTSAARVAAWLAANATPLVYRRNGRSGGLAHHWWRDVAADKVGHSRHGMFRDDGSAMRGTVGIAAAQALAWRALTEAAEVFDDRLAPAAASARRAFGHHYLVGRDVAFGRDDAGLATAATSDLGIVLWTGILASPAAERAVARLLSRELLSPFGIRTLPVTHPAFDPVGYHAGAVWPFDNWFASGGLGDVAPGEAGDIATRVRRGVDEVGFSELYGVDLDGRLLPSDEACNPQAWTVGATVAWAQGWDGRAWGAAV